MTRLALLLFLCLSTLHDVPGAEASSKAGKNNANPEIVVPKQGYIELLLVVEHGAYEMLGGEKNAVYENCKYLVDFMNVGLTDLNLLAVISDIVIWTEGNPIEIAANKEVAGPEFRRYIAQQTTDGYVQPWDAAQLISSIWPGATGCAQPWSMCNMYSHWATSISTHYGNLNNTAMTMLHELTHNFGYYHDWRDYHIKRNGGKKCCETKKPCVMDGGIVNGMEPDNWSNCTRKWIADRYNNEEYNYVWSCLYNYPRQVFAGAYCGNGLVEEGEECDCGGDDECEQCCNPGTCKLQEGAQCYNGECCDREACQMYPKGTSCSDVYVAENNHRTVGTCDGSSPKCIS